MGLYFAIAFSAMLFISLTTLFVALRTSGRFDPLSGHYVSNWVPLEVPFSILALNSIVIIASSICIEVARRKAAWECVLVPASLIPGLRREPRLSRAWAAVTLVLGAAFLYGQLYAWRTISAVVPAIRAIAARSFVYLLTGTHALHFASAMLVLTYGLVAPRPRQCCETWRITMDLTARYWHFMAVMWGYVLLVLWALH
jgi:cytochrome c oxidase subunit 3